MHLLPNVYTNGNRHHIRQVTMETVWCLQCSFQMNRQTEAMKMSCVCGSTTSWKLRSKVMENKNNHLVIQTPWNCSTWSVQTNQTNKNSWTYPVLCFYINLELETVRVRQVNLTPVITWSQEGGIAALIGAVCIKVASNMNKILEIHRENFTAVVQPGISREMLNQEIRGDGLWFPSWSRSRCLSV